MAKTINRIKQLFCKHDYCWCKKIEKFSTISGDRAYLVCTKCGKIKDTMFLSH